MRRMHGIDAFSIYSETPTSPFATLKVAIYRAADPDDRPDIAELRDFVKDQILGLGTGAAMRVVRVPFDLHHPVWVGDPDYSPDDHIYRAALPPPGDKAQLCDFLSDLMGRPLDPDRPLWEVWLIEGLEGGRIAVAMKLHHALADGKTVAALIASSHTPAGAPAAPSAPTEPEAVPGRIRLVADALVDLATTFTDELPSFVRDVRRSPEDEAGDEQPTSPPDEEADNESHRAPFTILNGDARGRYRLYRYETLPLPAVKALARTYDCTINTLVLGICSEALKRYLAETDTVPSTSLVAAMPMGDPGGATRTTRLHDRPPNNNLAAPMVPLHQDIDDFAERLHAIARSSRAAIERVHRAEGRRFDNLLEFVPGVFIRGLNAALDRQRAHRRVPANVVISNVPGPREPLRALGGRLEMEELLSVGNITDQGHLNITVWSYVDRLSFSFYLRKGALPEPDRIPHHVRAVFDELEQQLVARPSLTQMG